MTLWQRIVWAEAHLTPMPSRYRCVYDDPLDIEAPSKVMAPTAEWMAAARHGGILPPIDAYLLLPLEVTLADGRRLHCTDVEAQDIRATTKVVQERVLPHHALNTARPVGPMTEEQAIEYLIMKDVPFRVWGKPHNRPLLRIVTVDQLPKSRVNRNHWKLSEIAA
jgi:hypothetical protein